MKSLLRLIALATLLAALGYWVVAGANRGWTKTSVPIRTLDDVTGIEGVTYQKKFIPGVDFLAAAAVIAVFCLGFSFLFRTNLPPQTSNPQAPHSK